MPKKNYTVPLAFPLWVQIYENYWYFMKRSHFYGYLKTMGPFINHMATTLKGLISNMKILVALIYFLVNTFKIGFIPFLNKIRYFPMWTIFNSFKRI
jgi:hypothetical protein